LTGLVPEPTGPVYSATKSGVVSFTQALRVCKFKDMLYVLLHLFILQPIAKSDGVRVNCICPLLIDTDMVRVANQDIVIDERFRELVKHTPLLRSSSKCCKPIPRAHAVLAMHCY